VPVLPGFHQVCPTAIPIRTRHLRGLLRRSCSGDRRAQVRGPSEGRVLLPKRESRVSAFSSPVRALRRVHADVVPFLSYLWTSVVAGAFAERGGDPFSTPDRTKIHVPTLTREGQRHPADRDAFHRCDRVERSSVGLLRTRISRVGPSLTPPTLFPQTGESAFTGLASTRVRSPAIPGIRGTGRLFYRWGRSFRISRAWD